MYTTNQKIKFLEKCFKSAVLMKDGVEAVARCPACGKPGKNKLCIRMDNYFYHCWVCEIKGKSLGWLIKKYRPQFLEEYIKNFEDAKFSTFENYEPEPVQIVELPEDFKIIGNSRHPSARAIRNYLNKRGITDRAIWRFRIGYSDQGEWKRRAIIPSFDDEGKLNYYTGRAIDPKTFIKYLNVKIPRNSLIFNEIDMDWSQPINLVEGPIDLIKCPKNSTCLLGSYLSKDYKLFEKIVTHRTPVRLLLDEDAIKKSYKIANLFIQYNIPIKMGVVRDGDVGSMNPTQVKSLIEGSTTWNRTMALKTKIKNIKSGSIL
jgi:hypothetical protein